MSVSSEIKKANGLVSHSHKLIQLSWKPPKISKTPKNVARMKIKVQNIFILTFIISFCNPIFKLLSKKWPTNEKMAEIYPNSGFRVWLRLKNRHGIPQPGWWSLESPDSCEKGWKFQKLYLKYDWTKMI